MDDLLIRVLTRLVRVHDELGQESFEHAANRALVSIARSVQLDAERQAQMGQPKLDEGVILFPTGGSRQNFILPQ
ncbi:hypothetical protein SAMN06295905_3201 [Devosia lucknowensis]|uniref:Uncharacterized protein n=1 Tax=Devosia lucknowensis TaxID=1096929 RepID=A0A1Y6G719_9HYPH|nr:hypothetical protein [Devosia lucknowensis]SMQ85906.1 hypothetical protein SAMN06295905_3201 [Devosia lucknowensis]